MSKVKLFRISLVSVVIVCIFSFAFFTQIISAAETSDFEQLNATELVNEMGAGWNLGNQLEANSNGIPNETAWGNPTVTKNLIKAVKNQGFNTIRIPISYLDTIGNAPDYTIDSDWLDRIQEVVDYAYSQDLYVVINMHGDGYSSITGGWLLCNGSNQETIKAKYKKVWEQVAKRFTDYDEHLIFESMNEMFDGTYGTPNTNYYSNINDYNQIFIDTVRLTGENNAARWLLIPGWNTNIEYTAGNYGFEMPTDNNRSDSIPSSEKRIAMSVHYYDPWDFAGEESGNITQWGEDATKNVSTWGQENHMEEQFKKMYNTFVSAGYPFIVGEYGSINKTSNDSANNTYREYYAKTLCEMAKSYGGVPVYWDNGYNGTYGFGLFDRNSNSVTQQGIIDAITEVYENGSTTKPTETVTETNTETSNPTNTPTETSTSTTSGEYVVNYEIQNDWGSGGTISVTIENNSSSDINGWTLKFTFSGNQQISNIWNASYEQDGKDVTVENNSWNGTISANGGTASFGFNMSYSSSNDVPDSFILNGEEAEIE